ncbi:MAG: hypothetical protein AAGC44_02575 [Planctomycetota bacterium]
MQDKQVTAQAPLANPTRSRSWRRSSDRQGSAVILVIVSIVLIAILGATMVQVARFERLTDTDENIDVVVAATLDLIAIRLGEDLVDDSGNLFNPGGTFATGGRDEPFDYPFTRGQSVGFLAERIDGSTAPAWGGEFDDMWLASTEPNAAGTEWPHITNLNGLFLTNVGTAAAPGEVAVQGQDTNVLLSLADLIDADGDGINDSRWAWAPIKQIGATRYVMAVRIIDLSARLDVNVALAQYDSNAASPDLSEGIARGDTPAELDGAYVASEYALSGSVATQVQGQDEWEATMSYRVSGDATGNFPAPGMIYGNRTTSLTRQHYWFRGAARVSSTFNRNGEDGGVAFDYTSAYGSADAFEMLQNGGLDTPATTLLEQHMPLLTRDGANETTFTDFQATEQNYFARNIRLALSPFTGGGIYARPAVANSSDFATLGRQVDINKSNLLDLSLAILDIVGAPNFALPAHLASATAYAAQLSVNLKDYSDQDNWVSAVSAGGQTYYGFEALPMVSEVYVERPYTYTSAVDTSGAGTGPFNITWNAAANSGVSYAIEITNPYHRPIKLTDVVLRIGDSADIGGGDLASITNATYTDGMLPAGESFVIYREDATVPPADAPWTGSRLSAAGNSFAVTTAWGATAASGNSEVKLLCRVDTTDDSFNTTATGGGYLAATPYQRVDVIALPARYLENGALADPAGGVGVLQSSAQGSADGLNTLHYTPAEYLTSSQMNIKQPSSAALVGSQFGTASKAGAVAGKPDINDQQIVHQDRPMKYVGDILQVPVFGFEGGAVSITMAEQLEQSTAIATGTRVLEQLMLPYKNASRDPSYSPIDSTNPVLAYPHSVVLMDRLTVDSPYEDGEDNNGDGTADDEGEFVIPGRINLNTASRELLRRVLPYPDAGFRTTYANLLINRRNSLTEFSTHGFGVDGTPGIKYTGSVLDELIASSPATDSANNRAIIPAGHIDWNDHAYTVAPTTAGSQDYTVDGQLYAGDGIADDREEEIMISKWLSEVASVRSDVFAAYIIVQGYPAADFSSGPVESARLIAIFTRTNVRGAGDKAQVLDVLRLE